MYTFFALTMSIILFYAPSHVIIVCEKSISKKFVFGTTGNKFFTSGILFCSSSFAPIPVLPVYVSKFLKSN